MRTSGEEAQGRKFEDHSQKSTDLRGHGESDIRGEGPDGHWELLCMVHAGVPGFFCSSLGLTVGSDISTMSYPLRVLLPSPC